MVEKVSAIWECLRPAQDLLLPVDQNELFRYMSVHLHYAGVTPDVPMSAWWLLMSWCQIGAKPPATHHADLTSTKVCYEHILRYVYHVTTIKQPMSDRGREVANPLVTLLSAGTSSHNNNDLYSGVVPISRNSRCKVSKVRNRFRITQLHWKLAGAWTALLLKCLPISKVVCVIPYLADSNLDEICRYDVVSPLAPITFVSRVPHSETLHTDDQLPYRLSHRAFYKMFAWVIGS